MDSTGQDRIGAVGLYTGQDRRGGSVLRSHVSLLFGETSTEITGLFIIWGYKMGEGRKLMTTPNNKTLVRRDKRNVPANPLLWLVQKANQFNLKETACSYKSKYTAHTQSYLHTHTHTHVHTHM